ncbi:MAG: ATPase, T2SS/T4P/T4SS family [Burkholderia sp.]
MNLLAGPFAIAKTYLWYGGTGTGKATFTNAIIDEIAQSFPDERLVVIENAGELQPKSPNVVVLRSTDFIDMTRLLKATLRLRPDRIIVGEVRDGAALALLKAWNNLWQKSPLRRCKRLLRRPLI